MNIFRWINVDILGCGVWGNSPCNLDGICPPWKIFRQSSKLIKHDDFESCKKPSDNLSDELIIVIKMF